MQIEELERLHEAATPGPWGHSDDEVGDICGYLEPDEYRPIVHCSGVADDWSNNSALIVALRNALPDIIATYRERDSYKAALEDIRDETEKRQLPLTMLINDIARTALERRGSE